MDDRQRDDVRRRGPDDHRRRRRPHPLRGRAARLKDFPGATFDLPDKPRELLTAVRAGLTLGTVCSYLQGFDLLAAASREKRWDLDLAEIARVWRGGCIIRSVLLKQFQWMFGRDALRAQSARQTVAALLGAERQLQWRRAVETSARCGIPAPAMAASLAWYDSYRRERLPQNLVQALRDLFGAHTYERVDRAGTFHTADW